MRTAELLAIAYAIEILNDDDALDLFKEAIGEGQSSEEAGECRLEEELRWRACQDSSQSSIYRFSAGFPHLGKLS